MFYEGKFVYTASMSLSLPDNSNPNLAETELSIILVGLLLQDYYSMKKYLQKYRLHNK